MNNIIDDTTVTINGDDEKKKTKQKNENNTQTSKSVSAINTSLGFGTTLSSYSLLYSNEFFNSLQAEYNSIYYGLYFSSEITKTSK